MGSSWSYDLGLVHPDYTALFMSSRETKKTTDQSCRHHYSHPLSSSIGSQHILLTVLKIWCRPCNKICISVSKAERSLMQLVFLPLMNYPTFWRPRTLTSPKVGPASSYFSTLCAKMIKEKMTVDINWTGRRKNTLTYHTTDMEEWKWHFISRFDLPLAVWASCYLQSKPLLWSPGRSGCRDLFSESWVVTIF